MMKKLSDDHKEFIKEGLIEINKQACDKSFVDASNKWIIESIAHKYSYHFSWMGMPIIQNPQDIIAMQEILWRVKPDLVIETGVARGGSLIFFASMLEILSHCGGAQNASVIGIDIDIREHNREAIISHPLSKRISLIQGSSVDPLIISNVYEKASSFKNILVCLDSNHSHEHVLKELQNYAPLVSKNSYCVVFDTIVEDLPKGTIKNRPWDKGNNPKTAVIEFLNILNSEEIIANDGGSLKFIIDSVIDNKLMLTFAPSGFLIRK